jgi:hypothetical protein
MSKWSKKCNWCGEPLWDGNNLYFQCGTRVVGSMGKNRYRLYLLKSDHEKEISKLRDEIQKLKQK